MNNTILNSDTLKEMLDVSRNALHTIIRMKQTRQKMSNTQSLTTEQRIAIVADYNADKIKEIKELMEEEAGSFGEWLNIYGIRHHEHEWKFKGDNFLREYSTSQMVKIYQQSKTK